ncbi:MAG: PTS sugar transporter subunit IIB [Enterococcus sp.]|jgi:PTS system cellobiose-specific IIB component
MKKILLSCNGGFSTSILVQNMKEAAKKKNIEVEIEAVPETDVEDYTDWDILLLGPQIGHREEEFSEELPMPVFVIDSFDYGMMNGESVLDFALANCK